MRTNPETPGVITHQWHLDPWLSGNTLRGALISLDNDQCKIISIHAFILSDMCYDSLLDYSLMTYWLAGEH